MGLLVKHHDNKADDEGHDSNDHPLIVSFAERKFIHNFYIVQYNSSKDILRYFLIEKKVLSTAIIIPVTSKMPSNIMNCS